jgi:hypothetical protein
MVEALIGIGFWRSFFEPLLPDPARFIDDTWPAAARQQVVAYLKQGRQLHAWMGTSWCRFRCGESDWSMGAWDLTDGTYCWPEGLAHYVANHAIRLPAAIELHILAQQDFPHQLAAHIKEGSPVDKSWWQAQAGWNTTESSFWCGSDEEAKNWLRRFDRQTTEFSDTSAAATQVREQMLQPVREKLMNNKAPSSQ